MGVYSCVNKIILEENGYVGSVVFPLKFIGL